MAEVAIPRELFVDILSRIGRLDGGRLQDDRRHPIPSFRRQDRCTGSRARKPLHTSTVQSRSFDRISGAIGRRRPTVSPLMPNRVTLISKKAPSGKSRLIQSEKKRGRSRSTGAQRDNLHASTSDDNLHQNERGREQCGSKETPYRL